MATPISEKCTCQRMTYDGVPMPAIGVNPVSGEDGWLHVHGCPATKGPSEPAGRVAIRVDGVVLEPVPKLVAQDCTCPRRMRGDGTLVPEVNVMTCGPVPCEDGWFHLMACPVQQRAPKDPQVVAAHEALKVQGAQALIDSSQREVERVALKYGVPRECLPQAIQDFARELVPHAGREASVHAPSHYKRWFRGWAAGWRAALSATEKRGLG